MGVFECKKALRRRSRAAIDRREQRLVKYLVSDHLCSGLTLFLCLIDQIDIQNK
jgi:hypothetical protein